MRVAVLGAVLLLAGCANPPTKANPPVSMQSQGTILPNHPPESANSLPPGAQVVAPLTERHGQLNSVPVGPPGPR